MTTTLDRPTTPAPPARSSGAKALLWVGAVLGAGMLASGAYSLVNLLVSVNDDPATVVASASYDAAPVVELVADGDITVTTGGSVVDVERTSRTASVHAKYTAVVSGDRLVVRHECDWWRPGFCSAGLDVTVPDGTEVVVRASDGAVTATSLSGPLTVRTSDGRTTVDHVEGDVSVHASDGETSISDVDGDVTAQSSDGRITVSGVSGSVSTHAKDGDTTIEATAGDIDARASDGAVTVYGNGVPVALTMTTSDGKQTIEAPTDPAAPIRVTIHTSDGHASYLAPR